MTKGAASGHLGWVRRAAAHPQVVAALAEGHVLSESVARRICQWTDKLPEDCRLAADAILIVAAKAGADLRGLAELAAEIYARSLPDTPDGDKDEAFEDRSVRLETTFDGAGVLSGDLTPECAAVVTAVLDALSAPAGAEDTRTYGQRYHDALQEAMRRLVAGGLLPERAGSASEGGGAHLPSRPVGHEGQFGASGGVDRLGPGRLGRRAGRSVGGRERRGGVAGQRCRPRGRLRRVSDPCCYRRREPRRP